jgi:uncharacterized lipoprotein YmbA
MFRMKPFAKLLTVCMALALPLMSACGKSAPVRFYSLASEYTAEQAAQDPKTPCVSLGVGPVDFPAYLDRTQIVTRGDANRMNLSEFDQWIEPVQANFTSALMDALVSQVCAKPLVGFPWPGGVRPDRQIAIQVREFDGKLGREAVLRADWSIIDKDGKVLVWKSTLLREACPGVDYGPLVAAQSRLVGRLAKEIAQAISGLPK